MPGTEPRPQRWEARVLLLCHRGPHEEIRTVHQMVYTEYQLTRTPPGRSTRRRRSGSSWKAAAGKRSHDRWTPSREWPGCREWRGRWLHTSGTCRRSEKCPQKNNRISDRELKENMHLFIKLGFNVTFNTLYRSWLVFCGRRKPVHTVGVARFLYCKTADQRQATTSFPHLRSGWDLNSDLRGGRRECYYSATVTA